jgi:hypothetical protein
LGVTKLEVGDSNALEAPVDAGLGKSAICYFGMVTDVQWFWGIHSPESVTKLLTLKLCESTQKPDQISGSLLTYESLLQRYTLIYKYIYYIKSLSLLCLFALFEYPCITHKWGSIIFFV